MVDIACLNEVNNYDLSVTGKFHMNDMIRAATEPNRIEGGTNEQRRQQKTLSELDHHENMSV